MPGYVTAEWRADNRRIVSVDGEGQDVAGRHAYVLLAAADDRGYRAHVRHDGTLRPGSPRPALGERYGPDDVAPNHGLPTRICLDFLLDVPEHKSDLIISFAFTYDVTRILLDLPLHCLEEYADTGRTVWEGYEISGLPRKFFRVRSGGRECKVWDTFTYWQMAFAKALRSSRSLFTDAQWDKISFIEEMKAERGELEKLDPAQVLDYCYSECEYLSILYRDFLRQCEGMDLRVTRYSGPGALAEAFFAAEKVRSMMPRGDSAFPCGIQPAVPMAAYYGGRFETAVLGTVGDVIEYDIHSAYPAIAVDLPCLACGQFERVREYVPGRLGYYFVGSRTSGPWAPFPFRASADTRDLLNGASKGSIAYAHGGRRWATSYEVEVARRYFGVDAIPVFDGWVFRRGCNHKPFDRVRELYLLRKVGDALGRKPDEGTSKLIKLIINSIYGKLAQSIGWKLDRRSGYHFNEREAYSPPTYQCYIWASWITGGCRAKVLEAAMLGGTDVVSIATDGILSRREIPELPVTDYDLGTWEREEKQDCWLGMPGIYAFGRDADGKRFKRRGLDGRYFPAQHLRDVFESGEWMVPPTQPVRAFMPLSLAVTRTNSLDVLGEWVEMPKRVSFGSVQHKRDFPMDVDPMMPHDGTAISLEPFALPDDIISAPYRPKQTWRDVRDTLMCVTSGRRRTTSDGEILDPDIPIFGDTDFGPDGLAIED